MTGHDDEIVVPNFIQMFFSVREELNQSINQIKI